MPAASLWDLISAWGDTPDRPQDFVWALDVEGHDANALQDGWRRAFAAYPNAAARLEGERWVPAAAPALGLSDASPTEVVELELSRSAHPAEHPPLTVTLCTPADAPAALVVHAHHALCDLAGLLCFLDVLLGGDPRRPTDGPGPLRTHPSPRRKQRHAPAGRSRRLVTTARGETPRRRGLDLELEPGPLEAKAAAAGGTYNDLLACAFLDALADHQRAHRGEPDRLALWLPMNARGAPFEGFGNGTSRLRIYRDAVEGETRADRIASFARQRADAKADGEWCVPAARPAPGLPLSMVRGPLMAYLRRPWVDMGSAPFSHATRLGLPGRLEGLRPRTLIMNLHAWHPVGLSGVTHRGRTHLTFTWDRSELGEAEVRSLADRFLAYVEAA